MKNDKLIGNHSVYSNKNHSWYYVSDENVINNINI